MQWVLTLMLVVSPSVVGAVEIVNCNLTPNISYTVPYNSDENITYHCEIESGQGVLWAIISPNFNQPDIQLQTADSYRENGLFVDDIALNESRMIVTQRARNWICAHYENPRIEIACFPSSSNASCNASTHSTRTVTMFGPLDPPSSIRVSARSENQLRLSWTAPKVPSSEVDILYYVQVTNLLSGALKVYNTSEDSYTFNETASGICSEFNLTVFASNEQVGNSSVVSILENIPISPNVSTISESIDTVVDLAQDVSITVKFRHATACSDNYLVQYYTMMLDNGVEILPPRIANCTDFNEVCATINKTDIPTLSVDQVVKYNVSACSNVTCRTTETLTAYTTGVQQPIVYFVRQSTYVLVTCDFANGSMASGCLFNFTYATTNGDSASEMYNFTRESKENSKLCIGGSQACMCIKVGTERFESYSTIEAFTLEEDGFTRSRISVPVIRRNVSDTPEMIAVCNPPSNDGNSELIGGVSVGVVAIIAAAIIIVIITIVLVRKGHQEKPESGVVGTSLKVPASDGPVPDHSNEDPKKFEITVRARVCLTKNRTVYLKLNLDDEETIQLIKEKAEDL